MIKVPANCSYCGEEVKNHATNIKKHLKSCTGIAAHAQSMSTADYLLLKVTVSANGVPLWLLIKAHPNTLLAELDTMLRQGWLECCEHLSQFHVNVKGRYQGLNEDATLGQIFAVYDDIDYTYDFGSSTELNIAKIGTEILPNDGTLVLLLRNVEPHFTCTDCGAPAVSLCQECAWEEERNPFRCEKCAKKHKKKHDEADAMGIFNSPRMGVCAYNGPDDFDEYLPSEKEEKPSAKPKKFLEDIYKDAEDDFMGFPFGDDDDDDDEMDETAFLEILQNNPEMIEGFVAIREKIEAEVLYTVAIHSARLLEHYINALHEGFRELPAEDFFTKPNKHTHSVAEIMNHLSLHIKARYSKPFDGDVERHRKPETEFDIKGKTLEIIFEQWNDAWSIFFDFIGKVNPEELVRMVVIGDESAPLFTRITSSLAHYNYHIGQMMQQVKSISPVWKNVFSTTFKPLKKETKEININTKKKK